MDIEVTFRSTLVEQARDVCQSDPGSAVAFWYCEVIDNLEPDPVDVLASIIDQLLRAASTIPAGLAKTFDNRRDDQPVPRPQTMVMEALKQLISGFSSVYLFIDALDKFPKAKVSSLVTQILAVYQLQLPQLHILVTSRADSMSLISPFQGDYYDALEVSLESEIRVDINRHIRSCLQEDPAFRNRWQDNPDLLAKIEKTLTYGASNSQVPLIRT
jgi:hypothetical protein